MTIKRTLAVLGIAVAGLGALTAISTAAEDGGIEADMQVVEFGKIHLQRTVERPVTVFSASSEPRRITGVTVTGDDGLTVVDDRCSGELVTDRSPCYFQVRLGPVATGPVSGTVSVIADEGQIQIPVTATIEDSGIEFSPATHDFGPAPIDGLEPRPRKTFVVTSTGTTPAHLGDEGLNGATILPQPVPGRVPFRIVSDGCDRTLLPGESCSVEVEFDPRGGTPGERKADLAVSTGVFAYFARVIGTATPSLAEASDPSLKLRLHAPRTVKRGRTVTISAKIASSRAVAERVTLKPVVTPTRAVRVTGPGVIPRIADGATTTRKIRVKARKKAKRGSRIRVKVIATSPGAERLVRTVSLRVS